MSMTVYELGRGPNAVVVLNAMWAPRDYVHPLVEALAGSWRVLIVSYPGYDGVRPHDGEWSCEVDRLLLEGALHEHRVREAAVVGSSIGGYRALALACSGRVRVRAAVLLGGFAYLSAEERAGMAAFAEVVRSRKLPGGALASGAFSPSFAAAHPEAARRVEGWAEQVNLDSVATELDSLARCEDLRGGVAKLDVPLLLRAGDQDAAVAASHSREIAAVARAGEIQIVSGAGHMLLIEDAAATVEATVRFLERSMPLSGAP
jgi:3-oxoadipate enol-lactonase